MFKLEKLQRIIYMYSPEYDSYRQTSKGFKHIYKTAFEDIKKSFQ